MIHRHKVVLLCTWAIILLLAVAMSGFAQELTGKVIDESGQAVAGVKVSLSGGSLASPLSAISDEAGHFRLPIAPGSYDLKAEKPGYYVTISKALGIEKNGGPLEVVMNRQQEYRETVNVTYSAPAIDRQKASATATLTGKEIADLPYAGTQNFRNALSLIPGIVKDNGGHLHMNGGSENEVTYSLDGFNVASPVSGVLESRIPIDSIGAVRIETTRYSAEYGKGSAGVMVLESSQGDDRFRFSSTSFLPTIAIRDGLEIGSWTPRASISGPIAKGRAWFFSAVDLRYGMTKIRELPQGANTNNNWLGSNLTRIKVNLPGRNTLTGSFLLNLQDSRRAGISSLDPAETSRNLKDRLSFFNLRDQAYLEGWVLEAGVGLNQSNTRALPQGNDIYTITTVRLINCRFLETS